MTVHRFILYWSLSSVLFYQSYWFEIFSKVSIRRPVPSQKNLIILSYLFTQMPWSGFEKVSVKQPVLCFFVKFLKLKINRSYYRDLRLDAEFMKLSFKKLVMVSSLFVKWQGFEAIIYRNKSEKSFSPIGCTINDKSQRFMTIWHLPLNYKNGLS